MKVLFIYMDLAAQKNRKGELVCTPGGWFQEGIASMAACLRRAGHQVALYHLVNPVERDEFVRLTREFRQRRDNLAIGIDDLGR